MGNPIHRRHYATIPCVGKENLCKSIPSWLRWTRRSSPCTRSALPPSRSLFCSVLRQPRPAVRMSSVLYGTPTLWHVPGMEYASIPPANMLPYLLAPVSPSMWLNHHPPFQARVVFMAGYVILRRNRSRIPHFTWIPSSVPAVGYR